MKPMNTMNNVNLEHIVPGSKTANFDSSFINFNDDEWMTYNDPNTLKSEFFDTFDETDTSEVQFVSEVPKVEITSKLVAKHAQLLQQHQFSQQYQTQPKPKSTITVQLPQFQQQQQQQLQIQQSFQPSSQPQQFLPQPISAEKQQQQKPSPQLHLQSSLSPSQFHSSDISSDIEVDTSDEEYFENDDEWPQQSKKLTQKKTKSKSHSDAESTLKQKKKPGRKPTILTDTQRTEKARSRQEKNRVAAKRCRDRRNQYFQALDEEVASLRKDNAQLLEEITKLKSQLSQLGVKNSN